MGALADAVLLAAVAVGSVRSARAMLRASWPRRSPAAAILLWQALGLAGGLAAVGALLAIGVSGPGKRLGVVGGLAVLAGRVASGQLLAPHQSPLLTAARLIFLTAGVALLGVLCCGARDGVRRRGAAPGAGSVSCSRCSRTATPRSPARW